MRVYRTRLRILEKMKHLGVGQRTDDDFEGEETCEDSREEDDDEGEKLRGTVFMVL
jgi:hypothetical protein